MSKTSYRPLTGADAEAVRTLRLNVHQTDPESFSTTIESERNVSIDTLRQVLDDYEKSENALIVGAFDSTLVAMIGVERSSAAKARLWGLYVRQSHRGQGIGAKLLSSGLVFAALKIDSNSNIDCCFTNVTEPMHQDSSFLLITRQSSFATAGLETIQVFSSRHAHAWKAAAS